MNLTDEEIQIKVAEVIGWSNISHHKIHAGNEGLIGSHIAKDGISSRDWVPNYPLDLDACAEFEATLTEDEQTDFIREVNKGDFSYRRLAFATARQRCIAYLKTKGLIP